VGERCQKTAGWKLGGRPPAPCCEGVWALGPANPVSLCSLLRPRPTALAVQIPLRLRPIRIVAWRLRAVAGQHGEAGSRPNRWMLSMDFLLRHRGPPCGWPRKIPPPHGRGGKPVRSGSHVHYEPARFLCQHPACRATKTGDKNRGQPACFPISRAPAPDQARGRNCACTSLNSGN
jgi:hypothetical protein